MLVYDLFDYLKKKLPFEVLQNVVREKPDQTKVIATSESSFVAYCFGVIRSGNFREFWYWAGGGFSSFRTGIPGGPGPKVGIHELIFLWSAAATVFNDI